MALTSRAFGTLGISFVALLMGASVADRGSTMLFQICGALGAATLIVSVVKRATFGIPTLVFLIAVFPVARIVVHGLPIYGTDVLALLLVVGAIRLGGGLSSYGWFVIVYLGSWTLAWLHEVVSLQLFLAPTYGLVRNVLAVSIFFPAYLAAKRYGGQTRWMVALALGAATTSVLALLQDVAPVPINRILHALAPNFTTTGLKPYPHRAFALFAAPTTLAGFLAVATLLFVAASNASDRRQRKYLVVSSSLCVVGMLATYSRQWLPAVAAGLIALAWLRLGMARRVIAGAAVSIAVAWLLVSTGAINSSYLNARFSTLGGNDVNVQSRISRQRTFLSMVGTQPTTLAVGKGFAGQDIVDRRLVSAPTAQTLRAGLNDNAFLLEVFNHGIVAGLRYFGLLVTALVRVLAAARRKMADTPLLAGIGSALVVTLVLQFSDNYFSESVFMKMFLWLLIGTGIGLVEHGRLRA